MKLVVFDVDGTLVDSQGDIVACLTEAFAAAGKPPPSRTEMLSVVGLSLPIAIAELAPGLDAETLDRMVETYKDHYAAQGSEIYLFDGAQDALAAIARRDDWLMGIATGKSRRGLDRLMASGKLGVPFVTTQTADFHPSKPHPAMLQTALSEANVSPGDAVMIGDTTFDKDMAAAAGVPFIGVSWGYHPVAHLEGAVTILDRFDQLVPALEQIWSDGDE